ncbi:GntR family transcriptional regulator [Falsochrobactrum sp. TDYN1]|uniref:GntR family transcriptional regulator n=1 Tax=Falsochrobactrum tianjinense TaxID=2706015 RepID=A0A949UV60_9HYPH|nr:GntR family transcriptional regulator [Falsochrobactrum sp. TDYN1]MBV2143758.1 GntR family transcriptional regulator [Falsochrobactrum sp. TDYN1]
MNINHDYRPLYAKIEAALASDISDGILLPGSQLPPEDRLIERFSASRTTVRKAVENLVLRGQVEIRRGKGTFVTKPRISQELTELTGFVEDMQALGRTPTARLLDKQIVPADTNVARQLAVPPGSLVMRIQRVRLADGVAISFDETYLPRKIGEKIVTHDLDAEPIFSLLEGKYDLPLTEAEYRLEAVTATPNVAQALAVDSGSAVFLIERTSYTEGHRPIDYEKLHYRGDLISFVTRLARRSHDRP